MTALATLSPVTGPRLLASSAGATDRLVDRFMPVFEWGDDRQTVVRAPTELVFDVAHEVDPRSEPLVRALLWAGAKLFRVSAMGRPSAGGLVATALRAGLVELGRRPGRELVMGAAARPWRADPTFEAISPESFAAWAEPGYLKIVWSLEVQPLGPCRTRFQAEARVLATDAVAQEKLRRLVRLVRPGIALAGGVLLRRIRQEAERRERASHTAVLDAVVPHFDATLVRETVVRAPVDVTFAAIRDTDLMDPVVRSLFAIRELGIRPARNGPSSSSRRHRRVTLDDLLAGDAGLTVVAEDPGAELVVGAVGRFWRRDYGHHRVSADEFRTFKEPGFARLAMSFAVRSAPNGDTILRYEARTATTDTSARRHFRRYWRTIRPGVAAVMRKALARIRWEAEQRALDAGATRVEGWMAHADRAAPATAPML